jgi:hypothetical protein
LNIRQVFAVNVAREESGATFFFIEGYFKPYMQLFRSISHAPVWRLRLLATVLAVVGQLGISAASLTLARDESSAVSHTERSGIDLHRGHNEATCAACAALSFHANVNNIAPADMSEAISRLVIVQASVECIIGAQSSPNSCRAPPRES